MRDDVTPEQLQRDRERDPGHRHHQRTRGQRPPAPAIDEQPEGEQDDRDARQDQTEDPHCIGDAQRGIGKAPLFQRRQHGLGLCRDPRRDFGGQRLERRRHHLPGVGDVEYRVPATPHKQQPVSLFGRKTDQRGEGARGDERSERGGDGRPHRQGVGHRRLDHLHGQLACEHPLNGRLVHGVDRPLGESWGVDDLLTRVERDPADQNARGSR